MDPLNPILIPEDEIEFESREIPFNTSGGSGDIFVGQHPTVGTVAVKRLRFSRDSTAEADSIRVSFLVQV